METEFRKNVMRLIEWKFIIFLYSRMQYISTKFGRSSRRCTSLAPERNIYKQVISEIIMNRELSRNVATEYFTPELTDIFRC